MESNNNPKIWTKNFVNIALSNFFIFVVFYALLTILPIYVLDELHGTNAQAGLVVTTLLLAGVLVRPFSGKLLQDFGKKKIVAISMFFFMLSSFMYIWIDSFVAMLALRFFHGIWFGIGTTATGAIAADVIPQSRRGEGLGYFVMSMNLAVVVGPFIALTLLQFVSFDTIFFILSLFMIGGILCTMLINIKVTAEQPQVKHKLSLHDLFETKSLPIALTSSLVAFAYSGVISFISIYAKSLDLMEASKYFFVAYAVAMLISRPFAGRLFDSVGPNLVIFTSLILFAIGLVTLSAANSALLLLLSGVLIGLGYGTLLPSFQTLAVQAAPNERSGHATATFFMFFDSGIAVGSYILGIIVSFLGYQHLYFYSALLVLLVMPLYKFIQTKRKAIYSPKLMNEKSL